MLFATQEKLEQNHLTFTISTRKAYVKLYMKFALNAKLASLRNMKQYGKIPSQKAECKLWDVLCIDLIDQYQFTPKGGGKKYQMTTKNGNFFRLRQSLW